MLCCDCWFSSEISFWIKSGFSLGFSLGFRSAPCMAWSESSKETYYRGKRDLLCADDLAPARACDLHGLERVIERRRVRVHSGLV